MFYNDDFLIYEQKQRQSDVFEPQFIIGGKQGKPNKSLLHRFGRALVITGLRLMKYYGKVKIVVKEPNSGIVSPSH